MFRNLDVMLAVAGLAKLKQVEPVNTCRLAFFHICKVRLVEYMLALIENARHLRLQRNDIGRFVRLSFFRHRQWLHCITGVTKEPESVRLPLKPSLFVKRALLPVVLFYAGLASAQCPPTITPLPGSGITITATGVVKICAGDSVILQASPATGETYQWYKGGILIPDSTRNILIVKIAGNYRVKTGSCATWSDITQVVVNPLPTAYITSDPTPPICSGDPIELTLHTNANQFVWLPPVSPLSAYDSVINLSLSSSTTLQAVAVISSTGCSKTASFHVQVDIPIYGGAIASDQVICSGQVPSALTETSSPTGGNGTYTYYWQQSTVSAYSGFTTITGAVSAGYAPSALTQTTWFRRLVESPPCAEGISNVVEITVNQVPSLTSATTVDICSGEGVDYTPQSSVAGTTFSWTASVTAGTVNGVTPAGTGNINDVLTLPSGTTSAGAVTYVITPAGPAPTYCTGTATSVVVSVSPRPSVTNAASSQVICSGSTSTAVTFTSDISGTTFEWSTTALPGVSGITLSGSGNLPAMNIFSTLTDPVDVIYTVTPTSAANCEGTSFQYTITIDPSPTVINDPLEQFICSGATSSEVVLQSNVSGTTFTWTATPGSGDITGFTASGGGIIPGQTLLNASVTQGYVTYSITPGAGSGSCPAASRDYVIYVDPIPQMTSAGTADACSGSLFGYTIQSDVAGASFSWNRPVVAGVSNGAGSGSSSSISETLFNVTTVSKTVLYNIEITGPGPAACTSSGEQLSLTLHPLPTVDAGTDQTINYGTSTSLHGTASGETLPLTYQWSPAGNIASGGNTTDPVTSILNSSTNFTFQVTDGANCSQSDHVWVNITGSALAVSPSASPSVICEGETAQLTAAASGGSGTYTYLWTPAASLNNPASAGPVASPLTTTTYTVEVNDGYTTVSNTVTVTVISTPAVFNLSGGGHFCLGATGVDVDLDGSASGLSYTLLLDGTELSSTTQSGTGSALTWTTLTDPGIYTAIARAGACQAGMSGAPTVVVDPLPTPYTMTGGGTYPAGGPGVAIGLSSSQVDVNYSLEWIGHGIVAPSPVAGTGSAISFGLQTGEGNYRVLATDQSLPTACQSVMPGTVSVATNPNPTVFDVTGGGAFCAGSAGAIIGLSGSEAGITYELRRGGITTGVTVAGDGNPVSFPAQNVTGNYTVFGLNSSSGTTIQMNGIAVVTQNPLPVAFSLIPSGNQCPGTELFINGSEVGVEYTLLYNGYPVSTLAGTGAPAIISFGVQTLPGTYTVEAEVTATGCSRILIGTTVIVTQPEQFTVVPAGIVCQDQEIWLDGSESGINYQLIRDDLFNMGSPLPGTGGPLNFGSPAYPGVYTVRAVDPATLCSRMMLESATLYPIPTIYAVAPAGDTCAPVEIELGGSETGFTYELLLDGLYPPVATLPGTGNPLNFGEQSLSGVYTVRAVSNTSLCNTPMSSSVTLLPRPQVFNLLTSGVVCEGTEVALDGSETGVNYELILNNSVVAGSAVAGTGSPVSFGVQSVAGDYTVVAQNQVSSCSEVMNGVVTLVPLPLVYQITPTGSYCPGEPIGLSGSESGILYQLIRNNQLSTPVAVLTGTGNPISFGPQTLQGVYHIVAVNTVANCSQTMMGTVTIYPAPASFGLIPAGLVCEPAQIILNGSETGIVYELLRNGVSIVPQVTLAGTGMPLDFGNHTSGVYTVRAVNTFSCPKLMTGTVTVMPRPVVDAGPDVTVCEGYDYTLNPTVTNYSSVVWSSSGDGSFDDPSLLNATYTPGTGDLAVLGVTLTLGAYGTGSCTGVEVQDDVNISYNPMPLANAGPDVGICEGENTTVGGTVQFADSLRWTTSGTGVFGTPAQAVTVYTPSAADIAAGTVTLTLTSWGNTACAGESAVDQAELVIHHLPAIDAGADQAICANAQAAVSASSVNVSSVLWSTAGDGTFGNATNQSTYYIPGLSDIAAGHVWLRVTAMGTNACLTASAADSLLLTIQPLPVANAGADLATCFLDPVTLDGSAQNYSTVNWTGGNGVFGNATDLNSLYTPSSVDALAGNVTLTLTVIGNGQCITAQSADQVILTLEPLPVANAGSDGVVCAIGQYHLGGTAQNASSVLWGTSGTGSFSDATSLTSYYTPSSSDTVNGSVVLMLTATGSLNCSYATHSDQMTLTITPLPQVEAGSDQFLCAGETASLNAQLIHASDVQWITRGDGSFGNPSAPGTTYIPGPSDIAAGQVRLVAIASDAGVCAGETASDSLLVHYHSLPEANAGADAVICASETYPLNGFAANQCMVQWSTSGDGTFSVNTVLNPVYTPGINDIQSGTVTITLTSTGCDACSLTQVSDAMVLTIHPLPVADAGPDATICADETWQSNGTAQNQGVVSWSTTGDGTFNDPNSFTPIYTPGNGDKLTGHAGLILTAWGTSNCILESDADTMTLTIQPLPAVSAGPDLTVCASSASVVLNGSASNYTSVNWTTRGSGYFSNPAVAATNYFPSNADTASHSFYLVIGATGTGVCASRNAADSSLLTIGPLPVALAGNDDSICSGEFFQCNGTAYNAQSITWYSSGDGIFSNSHSLSAVYTPGTLDRLAGSVMLRLRADGTTPCGLETDYDTVSVVIYPLPTAVISGNNTICAGEPATLTLLLTGTPPWSIEYSDGLQLYSVTDIYTSPYSLTVAPSITTGYYISLLSDAHCNGVEMYGTAVVSVNPLPQVFTLFAESGGTFCQGGDGTELRLSGSQVGVSYQLRWGNQAYGTPVAGTGSPLSFGMVIQPGQYTVLARNTSTTCEQTMAGIVTVTVNPPPEIDFLADTTCLGEPVPITVSGSSVPEITTWLWNFGDGNSTLMYSPDDPMHIYASPGEFVITLTVTDVNGCQSVVSHPVRILSPAVAWFWWSAPACRGNEVNFQNLSYATDDEYIVSWHWQFGDGTDTIVNWPDNPDVAHQYSLAGNYNVSLTITTSHGCTGSIVRQVSILSNPVAGFSFTGNCQNNGVQFTDLSQPAGAGNIIQWQWDFGDPASGPSNASALQNPEHIYASTGIYTVTLQVFSGNGCSDTAVRQVEIMQAPVAAFDADTACLGNPTHFTDASAASAGDIVSWQWDFGDGSTSNNQNPDHLFVVAGLHTVTLTVGDAAGCEATVMQQVLVVDLPVAVFSASPANCAGAPVFFNDLSSTAQGTLVTWIWSFGDGTGDTVYFPASPDVEHIYAAPGSYAVTLTVITSNGCTDSFTTTVQVSPSPSANFSFPAENCSGAATQFTDQSQLNGGTPLMTWQWDFGDPASGTLNASTLQNPFHIYPEAGDYEVTLVVTNISTCSDTIVKTITVTPAPVAAFTADSVCQGDPTHFTDQTSASGATIVSWMWVFGDGYTSTQQNPEHTYVGWGNYPVTLTVLTSSGCQHDTTMNVFVKPSPVAAFEYNGVCVNDSVIFTDLSSTPDGIIAGWNWSFGDGGTSLLQSPSHLYASSGNYQAGLVVANSYGCSDEVSVPLVVFNKPGAGFDYVSHFCPAGQVEFQDMSAGNGSVIVSRFWDLGNGYTTTMANPVVTYAITDSCYNVTLVVENTHGCTDTVSQSVCVKPPVNFTVEAEPACYGVPVPFRSVNLTPGDSLYFVKWSFGDPGSGPANTSTLRNPSHLFSAPGNYLVKLKGWNSDNCVDSVYYEIAVNELPKASFIWDEGPHCDSSVVFYPDYQGLNASIDSVVWHFDDGSQLVQHQPLPAEFNHHFASGGYFDVSLEVFTWYGCHSDSIREVPVRCIDVDFEVVDSVVCQHETIYLNDLSVPNGMISQWEWHFGDGNTLVYNEFNPSFSYAFDTTGYFRITLITRTLVGTAIATDSAWKDILVRAKPRARFVADGHCAGSPVKFTDLSTIHQGVIASRKWFFGDGDSAVLTPVFHTFNGEDAVYQVSLVEMSDQGCSDTATNNLALDAQPLLNLAPGSGNYCGDPMDVVLSDTSGQQNVRWDWNTGDGEVYTTDTASVRHLFYPGLYDVIVKVTSVAGCTNTDTVHYKVFDLPRASFSMSEDSVGLLDPVIEFTDHSVPSGSPLAVYYWTFGDGSDSLRQDVAHSYSDTGHFVVTLAVTDLNGCTGTISRPVTVYPQLTFFMPTAFTPNWDKLNAIFKPVGRNINADMYQFTIFDRWGKLVFESFDPEVGWDGMVNGDYAAAGIYVWLIQLRDETGRPRIEKGTVMLVR